MTEGFEKPVRIKLVFAMRDYLPGPDWQRGLPGISASDLDRLIAGVLARSWGRLAVAPAGVVDFLTERCTDAEWLDALEAWFQALGQALRESTNHYSYIDAAEYAAGMMEVLAPLYRDRVNGILDDHDVAWQLVGEQVILRSSTAMHATIVEPVLALTTGDPRFAAVEKAFQDALKEMKPAGDPANAITDAGTALQEMLEAVGAEGNALGALLSSARKKELLAPYDSKLADAIDSVGSWVSADRSTRGDAHHAHNVHRDDAWLAIRVAGALILRLGAGARR